MKAVLPMLDHDRLTAALTEASEFDRSSPQPTATGLLGPTNFPISYAARNRIMRGVLDHTNSRCPRRPVGLPQFPHQAKQGHETGADGRQLQQRTGYRTSHRACRCRRPPGLQDRFAKA